MLPNHPNNQQPTQPNSGNHQSYLMPVVQGINVGFVNSPFFFTPPTVVQSAALPILSPVQPSNPGAAPYYGYSYPVNSTATPIVNIANSNITINNYHAPQQDPRLVNHSTNLTQANNNLTPEQVIELEIKRTTSQAIKKSAKKHTLISTFDKAAPRKRRCHSDSKNIPKVAVKNGTYQVIKESDLSGYKPDDYERITVDELSDRITIYLLNKDDAKNHPRYDSRSRYLLISEAEAKTVYAAKAIRVSLATLYEEMKYRLIDINANEVINPLDFANHAFEQMKVISLTVLYTNHVLRKIKKSTGEFINEQDDNIDENDILELPITEAMKYHRAHFKGICVEATTCNIIAFGTEHTTREVEWLTHKEFNQRQLASIKSRLPETINQVQQKHGGVEQPTRSPTTSAEASPSTQANPVSLFKLFYHPNFSSRLSIPTSTQSSKDSFNKSSGPK